MAVLEEERLLVLHVLSLVHPLSALILQVAMIVRPACTCTGEIMP